MPGDLVDAVRNLPNPGAALEAVVLARPAVKRVNVGGNHHVPEGDVGVQGPGDPCEQQRRWGELVDGAFGEYRRGLVAFPDEAQRDACPAARQAADLETGTLRVPMQPRPVQLSLDGLVLHVQCCQDDDRISAHCPGPFVFDGSTGRAIGGFRACCGPTLNSRAGRPVVALRSGSAATMNPLVFWTLR